MGRLITEFRQFMQIPETTRKKVVVVWMWFFAFSILLIGILGGLIIAYLW